jgi:hypothetical protein
MTCPYADWGSETRLEAVGKTASRVGAFVEELASVIREGLLRDYFMGW